MTSVSELVWIMWLTTKVLISQHSLMYYIFSTWPYFANICPQLCKKCYSKLGRIMITFPGSNLEWRGNIKDKGSSYSSCSLWLYDSGQRFAWIIWWDREYFHPYQNILWRNTIKLEKACKTKKNYNSFPSFLCPKTEPFIHGLGQWSTNILGHSSVAGNITEDTIFQGQTKWYLLLYYLYFITLRHTQCAQNVYYTLSLHLLGVPSLYLRYPT